MWSWGVGGHIEKVDAENGNPIHISMLRELGEEVDMDGSVICVNTLGYINYDANKVGKVHFGILYMAETDSNTVKPKDPEIDSGRLRALEELLEINSSPNLIVEPWSKIALDPLSAHLLGL